MTCPGEDACPNAECRAAGCLLERTIDRPKIPKPVMLWVGGSRFRCLCGANVFTKIEANEYRCNGCLRIYGSEET